jgi:pyroglutamyl-peptidase
MYGILHLLARDHPGARGGFIHVPYLPAQVVDKRGKPSMALDDVVRGLEAAVAAAMGDGYGR